MISFKLKKAAITILLTQSCLSFAAPANADWNIKIFNDMQKPMYYEIQDLTFTGLKKPIGSIAPNAQTNIVLKHNEDHHSGRVYISDKPFTPSELDGINNGAHFNYIEYNVGFNPDGTPFIDYDFSAVDSIDNVPLTVEATDQNNGVTGWVGIPNTINQQQLKSAIQNFTQITNWPTFNPNAPYNLSTQKIPGADLLFATPLAQLSSNASDMRKTLEERWNYWLSGSPEDICSKPQPGSESRPYTNCLAFATTVQKIGKQDLSNVYGFVNLDPSLGPDVTSVLRGVANDSDEEQTYLYPDYNSYYALDPYVSFIHKKLNLQVYAFSIDDSVGNIDLQGALGTIYVDLGDIIHLPNQKPYSPTTSPSSNSYYFDYAPSWDGTTVEIGETKHNITSGSAGNIPFNSSTFDGNGDLKINLTSTTRHLGFKMNLHLDQQSQSLTKSDCTLNGITDTSCNSSSFARGITVDSTHKAVAFPPLPEAPAAKNLYLIYPAGWANTQIKIGNSTQAINSSTPGSLLISSNLFNSNHDLALFLTNSALNLHFEMMIHMENNQDLSKSSCTYNGSFDKNCDNTLFSRGIVLDSANGAIDLPPTSNIVGQTYRLF